MLARWRLDRVLHIYMPNTEFWNAQIQLDIGTNTSAEFSTQGVREQKGGAGTGRLPAVLRPALRCTSRNGYHHPDCHRSRLYLQIHKGKHANIQRIRHTNTEVVNTKYHHSCNHYSVREILNYAIFVYMRTPITFVFYAFAFALLDFLYFCGG